MMKSVCVSAALLLGACGGAFAQASTSNAWIESFSLSPFETMQMSVAVATDKATGRKFNVVKLPNGKMMVLTSSEKFRNFNPFSNDVEMVFTGDPRK